MDREFHAQLQKFIYDKGEGVDIDETIAQFMELYKTKQLEPMERTPLDDAYDLLEQAYDAPTKEKARRLAKKAYTLDTACFDAALLFVELEESLHKKESMLLQYLDVEKKRLEKEGYFEESEIGHFHGIFETRPYIRGLYTLAKMYVNFGKMKLAKSVCQEIMTLNEGDNLGARYLLMGIHAYFEEEEALLAVIKKEDGFDCLHNLIPQFILYYKKSEDKKVKMILRKIKKANKHFIPMLNSDDEELEEFYQIGEPSEVGVVVEEFSFLFMSAPAVLEYIMSSK